MATYTELNQILTDSVPGAQELREKVGIASLVTVSLILQNLDTGAPFDQAAGAHDQRVKWAEKTLDNYDVCTRQMFEVVIAINASATQSQILNASDTAIQNNINSTVDSLAANL